mmetsp:Transcript_75242/g.133012  ORF Transcript_75242/g.133012 Transcript_75242/m.133012 type:complete len:159 (-) Transcript_75242:980-1456(-)
MEIDRQLEPYGGPSNVAAMVKEYLLLGTNLKSDNVQDESDSHVGNSIESLEKLRVHAAYVGQIRNKLSSFALTQITAMTNPKEIIKARKAYDELLMQQMMKVDAVESYGQDEVRIRRKELLEYIQLLHEQLDTIRQRDASISLQERRGSPLSPLSPRA